MKVAELLEKRRENWQQLDRLTESMRGRRVASMGAESVSRFAALYRAACADLALADSYQLPPNTVQYLHRLVGRAHNQLYRSRKFDVSGWLLVLLFEVPQRIFNDRCIQLTFCIFWGTFILSAVLARYPTLWPDYAENMLTRTQIESLEDNFKEEIDGRNPDLNFMMAGFYIQHNTSIGFKCFVGGLLIIPGLFVTLFNSAFLGAAFGYMSRPDVDAGVNFLHFVTAHGPFELTAIVLSAGAGLRLGVSWLKTNGLTRSASLNKAVREAMPVMGAAAVLFFLAAMIEGFLSPSGAPYWIKAAVAWLSMAMLLFYFLVLGFPRRRSDAAR